MDFLNLSDLVVKSSFTLSEQAMKSQVLHTVQGDISGEAAGENLKLLCNTHIAI